MKIFSIIFFCLSFIWAILAVISFLTNNKIHYIPVFLSIFYFLLGILYLNINESKPEYKFDFEDDLNNEKSKN